MQFVLVVERGQLQQTDSLLQTWRQRLSLPVLMLEGKMGHRGAKSSKIKGKTRNDRAAMAVIGPMRDIKAIPCGKLSALYAAVRPMRYFSPKQLRQILHLGYLSYRIKLAGEIVSRKREAGRRAGAR